MAGFNSLPTDELVGWVEDICGIDPSGMSRDEMLAALKATCDAAGAEATRREERMAKVEAAAVTEATRLCDQALAGMARVAADPAVSPWLPSQKQRLARAKRYQLDEFRPTYAKAQRLTSEAVAGEFASREEYLASVDLYCAAGMAEVERRFRQIA